MKQTEGEAGRAERLNAPAASMGRQRAAIFVRARKSRRPNPAHTTTLPTTATGPALDRAHPLGSAPIRPAVMWPPSGCPSETGPTDRGALAAQSGEKRSSVLPPSTVSLVTDVADREMQDRAHRGLPVAYPGNRWLSGCKA